MASNRSRSNRSVGNKLNNLDSRVGKNEKGTNNPHLSPDVIEEAHLTDASVAEAKLADRAVTETKLLVVQLVLSTSVLSTLLLLTLG